ncbi:MAG TPA: GlsB/YeaQ/YmgE family stress response membrane protein [Longimicrobiales bacterium]|nr:GlsB/YeaQ/YmgE family stress response membrane protein [Longimicrobiales bacterium]
MNLLSWILFGLIAGALAKWILPGKDPGGCLVTILIGIAGALIGGFLGTEVFDFGTVTGFNLRSFGIAILGAVILLLVYRLLVRRPR